MNCLSKKVQRNKAALAYERKQAERSTRTPEELEAIDRRGRAAMQFLAAAMSVSTLGGQAPYTDTVFHK